MASEAFVFSDDSGVSGNGEESPWKILSVEDDATYQASLLHSLRGIRFRDQAISVLTASSAAEAADLLSQHDDIGLVLLDVVMEDDDAGLRLVRSVREVLGNSTIRIVLLTGQPGMAPRIDVMRQYDIDEYWNKSDLTREKLHSLVNSHLRTWHYMTELQRAQRGLQMILDASRSLYSKQDLSQFTHAVLEDITSLIGIGHGGIICSSLISEDGLDKADIIAASGIYRDKNCKDLSDPVFEKFQSSVKEAIQNKAHIFQQDFSVLYFETLSIDGYRYLVVIDSDTTLSPGHINLLQVFSENVRTGFANVALLNRVTNLAYYDEKLNIINRNGLLREISSLNTSERNCTTLLLFSIRNFKDMMITFGERYCDYLLLTFIDTVSQRLPGFSACASIAPGEFALLFEDSRAPDDAQLMQETGLTLELSGVVHHLMLTFCRLELKSLPDMAAQEVLHLAESTLSTAENHHLPVINYSSEHKEHITSSYLLLQELQKALLNHELTIMLQPKVELFSGKPVGFEALVRWKRPDGSMVPPCDFIPLAEASGLVSSLDLQVLDMTLAVVADLKKAGYFLPVSFNAAVTDLSNRMYVQTIFNAIERGDVDPALLDIEITESETMTDYSVHEELLRRFIALGMGVSIDDFGTGYSSLSHIARLPVTTLKIDQSFVNGIETSEDDRHVVGMVTRIGQRFGYTIVAEGVETESQRQLLQDSGCHIGQGYLFSRPMPVADVIPWLEAVR